MHFAMPGRVYRIQCEQQTGAAAASEGKSMQHSSATAGGRPFGQSFFRGPQYHPSLRRQMRSASLAGLTLATSLMLLSHPAQAVLASDQAGMLSKASLSAVPFVANAGQWDARAAFAAPTFAGTLFVTTDGQLVYSLPPTRKLPPAAGLSANPSSRPLANGSSRRRSAINPAPPAPATSPTRMRRRPRTADRETEPACL